MGQIRADGRSVHMLSPSNTAVLHGIEDLSRWSDEELRRGHKKMSDGRWPPRPPRVIPSAIHDELASRLMKKAAALLRESTVDAVKVLRQVATNEDVNPATRIQAADLILSRTIPKSMNLAIGIDERPAFLGMIEASIVATGVPALVPGAYQDIVDAEVIEDDEIVFEE